MLITQKTKTKSHKVRTFFATMAGIVAVNLILASITIVWLNRTLTDTPTYVKTVAPLITKPAIQSFVSQKVAEELLKNAPVQDIATTLLPANQLTASQSDEQLKVLLKPVIETNVQQIIQSPSFATLWKNTNQTAHASLVSQLNSDSSHLVLDFSPAVNGVISELKTSQLSPIADKITVQPDTGKLDIKSKGLSEAHRFYKAFQAGTILIIVIALLTSAAAIWLSVNHRKTARRIVLVTGIFAFLQALLLQAPQVIRLNGQDMVTQAAARAIIGALVHNLQIASLVIGSVCFVLVAASKIYDTSHKPRA